VIFPFVKSRARCPVLNCSDMPQLHVGDKYGQGAANSFRTNNHFLRISSLFLVLYRLMFVFMSRADARFTYCSFHWLRFGKGWLCIFCPISPDTLPIVLPVLHVAGNRANRGSALLRIPETSNPLLAAS